MAKYSFDQPAKQEQDNSSGTEPKKNFKKDTLFSWNIVKGLLTIASAIFVARTLWNFAHSPTATSITHIPRNNVLMPEVMICPRWITSIVKLNDSQSPEADGIRKILSNAGIGPNNTDFEITDVDLGLRRKILSFLWKTRGKTVAQMRTFLRSLGPDCKRVFRECKVAFRPIPCCNYVRTIFEAHGSQCFHFKYPKKMDSLDLTSLMLIFDADYLSQGVIQNPLTLPGSLFTFTAQPNMHSTKNYNELPAVPNTFYKLLLEEEKQEKKNNIFEKSCDTKKAHGIEINDCVNYKSRENFYSMRNCTYSLDDLEPANFGEPSNELRENRQYCGDKKGVDVSENLTASFKGSVDKNVKCLPSCSRSYYRILQTSIPSNSLTIEFRLSSFNLILSRQIDQLTIDSVIGNIGGIVGFFLGASLMTVFQGLGELPKKMRDFRERK